MLEQLIPTQTLDKLPFAAYCGSLIQQNYGETVPDHGYLMWDLGNKTVRAFDVPNHHSYHTVKVGSDTDYDDLDIKLDATKQTHIKVQWCDYLSKLTRENQSKINRHLKERYKPVELTFHKTALKISENGHIIELSAERLADISSESNQRDIFTEYLAAQQYQPDDIASILGIHESVTERLRQSGYQDSKGYEFKLQKLRIENFKSYGDSVELDWEGKDGVWQITGENTAGKSTILDAITYLFYGTMLGAMTAEKNGENRFINNIRDLDYCEVGAYLLVNNIQHKLVRRTERTWQNSKGERTIKTVSTSVFFFECEGIDSSGAEMLKDIGVDRKTQTEKVLVEYFGTMQDFMRSSFINADTLTGLLSITHSVFVDSLLRDIGLDIFERLLKEFKSWRDDTHSKTKRIQLDPAQEEERIKLLENEIWTAHEREYSLHEQVKFKEEAIEKGSKFIKEQYALVQNVRPELEKLNPDDLRVDIHDIVDRISALYRDINVEEALLMGMVTTYSQEDYDILLEQREASQQVVSGFKASIREQENIVTKAQFEIQSVQGRMNVRGRDINSLGEKIAHQRRVDEKEIQVAEAELLNLETAKTCPTCKRLKNTEAIEAIQEVITTKIKHLNDLRHELGRYDLRLQLGEDEIQADIKVISLAKLPFEHDMLVAAGKINQIRAKQEASVLAVDEISQGITVMLTQRAIYDKKQRRETDLKQIPLKIENLKLHQETKVRLLDELVKAHDVIIANEKIHNIIDRGQDRLSVLQTEREACLNEASVIERGHVPGFVKEIGDIKVRLVLFAEQERQEGLLKAYEKCIHRDGIPTMLLKQYLSVINIQISNLLENMKFTLFLNDQLQFKMFNHKREDAVMNVLQGSGMQKTFASLVLRLALRQVNNKYRNNMLLMDEILGKLDPNHLERFGELVARSKEQIDKLVIIEHGYGDTINPDYVINVTTDKLGVSTMSY